MSVQVENLEKSMAKLTIEVSAEQFEAAMQKAYIKNKGRIQLPGFRKGKAPRAMIEKMYGAGIFYEDAANEIIPEAYEEAAKESGLVITSQPEIDVTQIEKGIYSWQFPLVCQKNDINIRHQVRSMNLIAYKIFRMIISDSIMVLQIRKTFRISSFHCITVNGAADNSLF